MFLRIFALINLNIIPDDMNKVISYRCVNVIEGISKIHIICSACRVKPNYSAICRLEMSIHSNARMLCHCRGVLKVI